MSDNVSARRSPRRLWRVLAAAAFGFATLSAPTFPDPEPEPAPEPAARCPLDENLVPACGLLWGIYTTAANRGQDLYTTVTSIESDIGRTVDLVHRYHDFSGTGRSGVFPDEHERRLGADGSRVLLLNWTTRIHGEDDRARWDDVADGAYDDSVVRPAARRLKEWDQPVFLAFDHEAEGKRHPDQGDGADYARAWRHIHDVFEEEGVDNVTWVWITVGWLGHQETIADFYPGDDYVDWIGYDPFNYYVCRDNEWRSPSETIGPWYNWLMRNGFSDKPVMLAEYGTVADPENERAQAQWYRDLVPALSKYPNIRAVSVFDTHKVCDTRVSVRPGVLDAWGDVGRDPYVSRRR
ncbi:glycoside hydrolase family 26 protein [Streptomyces sp. NBC_01803]|uniref:glycoside hydrolase family 26 protein n=1 Tax=Streptomyces sp. NBC_01803 TaxID=2975946 RepID=UPI002DDAD4F2|nr:glycosyl hydrolase [Streptomyces sp. NBC_01803]WSA46810.1 glycosyl hydrolase [Streptomyces sp. NBC_01803]